MGDAHSTSCKSYCNKDTETRGSALSPAPQAYDVGGTPIQHTVATTSAKTLAIEAPDSALQTPIHRDLGSSFMGNRSRWLMEQMKTQDPVTTACNILQQILEQDKPPQGLRADLEYVYRVLCDKRHNNAGSVKVMQQEAEINEAEDMDEETLIYLKSFGKDTKKPHKTFREVAQAVLFTQTLRKGLQTGFAHVVTVRNSNYVLGASEDLLKSLMPIDSYNEFDIFRVAAISGPALLQHVALTVYQRHKLIPHFNISLPKLRSFLAEIEQQYKANPYHNAIHAADVVQSVCVLVGKVPADTLSEMEVLTSVFAAACHDVGHDGVTNAFRIAALDDGAITYNDQSINENFHCSLTYRILQRDECNWLDSLTKMQSLAVRKLMIDIILSTDMANHFTKLAKVKSIAEERGGQVSKWESTTPCLELMVHAADISNPSKPMDIAMQWSDRVLEEFFSQGDRERTLGRDISPLCDRLTVSKPGSQCGFVDFIVAPTFEVLGKVFDVVDAQENMKAYRAYWGDLLQKEKEIKEADQKSGRSATSKISSISRSTRRSRKPSSKA